MLFLLKQAVVTTGIKIHWHLVPEDSAGVTSTNVYKWKRTGSRHTGEWELQTDRYKSEELKKKQQPIESPISL